jgi:formamidopyrimidine-DNA glycosylase
VRFQPVAARAHFEFSSHQGLVFVDPRGLGRMQTNSIEELGALMEDVGMEPFSDKFTPEWFYGEAKKSRQPAKLFLMDQTRVAGLGNIYAAEALFRAKIHPRRVISRVGQRRITVLHACIVQVLRVAVQSACNAYSGPGRFREAESFPCLVYGRPGQPCKVCHRAIRRIAQGGRSTYYCPGCQK